MKPDTKQTNREKIVRKILSDIMRINRSACRSFIEGPGWIDETFFERELYKNIDASLTQATEEARAETMNMCAIHSQKTEGDFITAIENLWGKEAITKVLDEIVRIRNIKSK